AETGCHAGRKTGHHRFAGGLSGWTLAGAALRGTSAGICGLARGQLAAAKPSTKPRGGSLVIRRLASPLARHQDRALKNVSGPFIEQPPLKDLPGISPFAKIRSPRS